jgi:hypothetical protein
VTEQISDIGQTIVDHRGSLKTQAPRNDTDVLGKTHGAEHLRSENTRVSDFNPALELRVETENFKTWLCVGVVSGLVLNLVDTNLCIEFLHDAQEVTETDISICDETLDLMELRQVSGVESLVAEDTINREIFHWFEAILTLALLG